MMLQLIVRLLLCLTIGTIGDDTSEYPEVFLSLGNVKGSVNSTRLGRPIFMFRGLRYAKTTAGTNRFKVAIPETPWDGVFDASQEGPACPKARGRNMRNDCLRLNVYTTTLDEGAKRPVIVHFHTGNFKSYSGQSYIYGPQYLLDEDIVLITVNYRLGPFGFTATGSALAPGNLGLKDQVEALRWVQKHVIRFGGNPNCVTIMGQGAGSWCVALHLLSPMSSGLFHRAISMSGSPLTGLGRLPSEQIDIAIKQAKLLGCPTTSTQAMLKCMEELPFKNITRTLGHFTEWRDLPLRIWGPVVEPDIPGVERFLPGQPIDLIRQGRFFNVPYMIGSTHDELASLATQALVRSRAGDNSIFDDFNENWEFVAPICFDYEQNSKISRIISDKLKTFYFDERNISQSNWKQLANLFSDTMVTFPINRLVNMISAQPNTSVYYYHFVYQGRYSWGTFPDTKRKIGVVQQDDLLYLFDSSLEFPHFDRKSPESSMVERMTAMWAAWAKTGYPIPRQHPSFYKVVWEPFKLVKQNYLEINTTFKMKDHLFRTRMEELYSIFSIV